MPAKAPPSKGASPVGVRPASPKKMLGPKAPPPGAVPAGAKSPMAAGMKKAPPAAAVAGKSPGVKVLVKRPASPAGAAATAAPAPAAAAAAAGAAPEAAASSPVASSGKKMFKRPVAAGAAAPAAAAASQSPAASFSAAGTPSVARSPPPQSLVAAESQAQFVPLQQQQQMAAPPSAAVDSALVVAPPQPGVTVQHPPLDLVIARNQEAAAALAILVTKQTEADRERLAIANEKVEAMQRLLVEREAEQKTRIDSLEKQLAFITTAHASMRRENELLKDVLADRDGPKMVQRLEQLEEANAKANADSAKYKAMAEYHRGEQLKAMEAAERLRNGEAPPGPSQTEWEAAQEGLAKMGRENATLTLRLGDLEERLGAALEQKTAMVADQQRQIELLALQREQQSAEQQRRHEQEMAQIAAADPRFANNNNNESSRLIAPSPARDLYRNLSSLPGSGGGYGASAASPSPYVNNSKFSGFAGSPLRGTVNSAASNVNNGRAGGTRGWRALMLPNGNVIYHNTISNRSQWEVPAELAEGMADVTAGAASAYQQQQQQQYHSPQQQMGGAAANRMPPPFAQYSATPTRGFL